MTDDTHTPDVSYDEAQKKHEDAIKAMAEARELVGRVAQIVGKYHVELLAQGVPSQDALELSKAYAIHLTERKKE